MAETLLDEYGWEPVKLKKHEIKGRVYVSLPSSLRVWLHTHPHDQAVLCRLVHVRHTTFQQWLRSGTRLEHWRVRQLKAAIEMGLVGPVNGETKNW